MEYDIIDRLSSILGRDRTDIEALSKSFASVLRDYLSNGDEVAIPSFGTFGTVKEDEHISTDLSSGERLLIPPSITPTFKPSSVMRRRISNQDPQ